jgi:hypothetical protein
MVLIASGMAACFVPLTLTAVSGVARNEQGIASALLNSGQQVGGSLGLATIGTIAATLTRTQLQKLPGPISHLPAGAGPAVAGHLPPALHGAVNHAFVIGYTGAFRVSSVVLLVGFVVAALMIRVRPGALAGAPAPAVA